MKMWGGRFRLAADPEFQHWQCSFEFDRRLLSYELAASSTHARALKNAGILSSDELIAMLQGLEQIAAKAASSSTFLEDEEAEDAHHFVQKQLAALIGEVAYKLHSERSRNEQIATDLRLYIRARIDQLQADLAGWLEVLLECAEQAEDAVMPAYTHLQRAEPVLVARYLLAYVEMFLRDSGRLADCKKRLNFCPLGSGAVAGAAIELALHGGFHDRRSDRGVRPNQRHLFHLVENLLSGVRPSLDCHGSRWKDWIRAGLRRAPALIEDTDRHQSISS